MFAYHDGIIDNTRSDAGITACSQQAYALLLSHNDELDSTDPAHFTYPSSPGDVRRYRLCAATLASRQPVRVLRSHTLRSFWSPRAGVRYDGLYERFGHCPDVWLTFTPTDTKSLDGASLKTQTQRQFPTTSPSTG